MVFSIRIVMIVVVTVSAGARCRAQTQGNAGVEVLLPLKWSPGDPVREGAGEFEVLLRVAQLQRTHRIAGLVSMGDRHGMRAGGGERALGAAALNGVAVVKLPTHGGVAATPDGIFLNGGTLSAEKARQVLAYCLKTYGAPP